MNEVLIAFFQKYPVLSTILAGLIAAHALAAFIVNLTPTPKDDEFVGKLYKFLEGLALIVTDRAKQLPGEEAEGVAYKTGTYLQPEDTEDEE